MSDIPVECHSCGFQGAISSYAEHKNRTCFKCGDELCFVVSPEASTPKTLTLKPRTDPATDAEPVLPAPAEEHEPKRSMLGGLFRRAG